MFKPHITVASVVHAEGRLLIVEETVNGIATWNQPAGHLEAGETVLQAACRELKEETGITASPEYFLAMHQWTAPDNTPFLRFLFTLDLPSCLPALPQDTDIDCCWWLLPEQIINAAHPRSPLVAESVRVWQSGVRYPLSVLRSL